LRITILWNDRGVQLFVKRTRGEVDARTKDKGDQREKRRDARRTLEDAICRGIV